jgi:hypothetical protein
MSEVLFAPLLVCAGLLAISGTAKLRSPGPAADALVVLGWPASRRPVGPVRALAVAELALAAAAALVPGRITAAALAAAYGGFALVATRLARRRAACGCFGEASGPASTGQALLSLAGAVLCALAVVWPAHGVGWVLGHGPLTAATLLAGVGASVWAAVLAYTELPIAWSAWGGR